MPVHFAPPRVPAPTGGHVFNRRDPRNAAGEVEPIIRRDGTVQKDAHNFVAWEGRDFTSLKDRNRFKSRIPKTSIVNRVGDFGCCGMRMTAAQWVWLLNFFCMCTHTTMVFVTAYFAYWRKDMSIYGDEDPYHLTIYRISARWLNSTTDGYELTVEDNGIGLNIAASTIAFFAISALAHLFAVVAGLFESTWGWYWRQIDDAFCWWRWLEYAGSCSLMGMLLAAAIGIREELTLACLFSLLAVTQSFGFLTELYSRPVVTKDETSYAWPVGRRGFIDAPDYDKNPNALYLISQNLWEGDRVIRDKSGALIAKDLSYLHAQRTSNWTRRLLPYAIGCFPFAVYIVVCTYYLEYNKQRLYESTNGELVIPSWINAALYGTFFLFSSFSYVLPLFQALPPGFYFGSEICYCILSLTAKLFLGTVILFNVIMAEGRANDSLGAGGLQPAR